MGNTQGDSASRHQGEASGRNPGLHHPVDERRMDDKLGNADLETRGRKADDHLRDSRSKGVAGGFDDSIDHDVDQRYVNPGGPSRQD